MSSLRAPSFHSTLSQDGTTAHGKGVAARRQALEEIDNAKFGWYHIRACLISGIGFFTDAYDIFIIGLVTQMLGYMYWGDEVNKNVVPAHIDLGLKVSASCGTLVGQLVFGWLGDRFGRKRVYGTEIIIIVLATFTSAFAANTERGIPLWGMLVMWRVILGFGIGGDYPLSATITSEFASTRHRGAMMSAVFAMQGFGILAGALTATVVLACFQTSIDNDIMMLDYVWRICIGLGAVPGFVAIYFRLTIPETPRYTMDVKGDSKAANKDLAQRMRADGIAVVPLDGSNSINEPIETEEDEGIAPAKASWSDFFRHFGQWRYGKVLIGTAVSWFALDVAFYGINLNNSIILTAIGYADSGTPYHELFRAATGNIIIVLLGAVPGYWVSVFTIDRIGRKTIQLMGFGILTVLFIVLGAAYHKILDTSTVLFIVLFTLAQFFQNFGPNVTTFVIPGEVFPTRYRSTAHGISAASGKLGAIVAQVGFSNLKDIGGKNAFMDKLLIIFAVFMFLGFCVTWLIPETKGKSLEELGSVGDEPRGEEENVSMDSLSKRTGPSLV
ncbi:phosphate:H+ symporter [Piptocephalis cylindrospora]|uniref:Phosphate:H+ symporter n=1 Tax=Piptocephalis cylindrospora TaxID=1907219 RepID=A0A4P9Y0M0_9FUNG|nr:phosphate:H+ symporter [Piptocephalis cylindrospora]|eukprot:RKP12277.1 phosphate:H+ symporter [Piptocephalis cylindrospora]